MKSLQNKFDNNDTRNTSTMSLGFEKKSEKLIVYQFLNT